MCPLGAACSSSQCSLTSGVYTFPASCPDCDCTLGLLLIYCLVLLIDSYITTFTCKASLVSSIYSPSYGATWYIGSTYTVQWISSNIPTVDVYLLLQVSSGGVFYQAAIIGQGLANTGSTSWTIPTSVSTATNVYFITVVPSGTAATLSGNTHSPPFSVQRLPSGTCPLGYISSTGSYPGCVACAQGSYSSVSYLQ